MNVITPGDRAPWRRLPMDQQPPWPDREALQRITDELALVPALVLAAECDRLRERLAEAAAGDAFVLQGGDCAETFDGVTPVRIAATLDTMRRMAQPLAEAAGRPVVHVGRIAGQYAKPRSSPAETRDGVTLPVYRGDIANDVAFTTAGRTPDPDRLRRAYHASLATLNLVRAMMPELYTSHEALVLPYEEALTRIDDATGRMYAASGHLLWIGERTRRLDGAHVAFAGDVANPVAVKLGPTSSAGDVLALLDRLDPERTPGRLTFITRMGANRIREVLPGLVRAVTASGARVLWLCDPMHGNTVTAPSGHKTRAVSEVLAEIEGFLEVHEALGTVAGGLHLELTGAEVTECVGGAVGLSDLGQRYESPCDPRLNRAQSIELATRVAALLEKRLAPPRRGELAAGVEV
ncbi:3-deoxy-7-phosphoheptulonate synthase [Actinoplanes utahensis]|uniref:3-deoxy-7-phosphoheptulonate synthase n=1 Tax=Actinoplanes utahensis TaxID=1869 RepID=UPI00068F91FE|nr:3-deoxy-7-phosphoheptulonate synthase class II [Actinoplanes utahensis]GIF33407.1 phospho-2-dehydro-3-deoxyheptonate aldolase [Actinoplanes utahensis]